MTSTKRTVINTGKLNYYSSYGFHTALKNSLPISENGSVNFRQIL